MIRFLLGAAILMAASAGYAQGLSTCREVIGATGNATTESGLIYAYTVGEPAIFTLKKQGVDFVLTQGFHQPDVCLPVSVDDVEEWSGWDIQAYPNPVVHHLTIQYAAPDSDADLMAQIVNAYGQVVRTATTVAQGGHELACGDLQAGFYVLVLTHKDKKTTVSIPFSKVF
jgi:hypothetical protein